MFAYESLLAETVTTETQQIARGLRQRDIALLQQLVGLYQQRLVRYLTYLTGRRDLVDDLVQETWLRVLERGHGYDGRSSFAPWLFTVARNLATDMLRKRRLVSLDSKDDEAGAPQLGSLVAESAACSPFEQAARSEDAQQLAQSLATLEPIVREALVLRFQEDLSLGEIAGIAGASVSTVASRIYRGLATLRTHLERGGREGVDHAN